MSATIVSECCSGQEVMCISKQDQTGKPCANGACQSETSGCKQPPSAPVEGSVRPVRPGDQCVYCGIEINGLYSLAPDVHGPMCHQCSFTRWFGNMERKNMSCDGAR